MYRSLLPTFVAGVTIMIGAALIPDHASAYTEKTLYAFCPVKHCADGSEPMGELVMDPAGNLYGTTWSGGAFGDGAVFQFVPTTGQYNVIYSFCSLANCADGRNPEHVKLVMDTDGNLYGTTYTGGNSIAGPGVVFELKHEESGWVEEVLYTFCPNPTRCNGPAALAAACDALEQLANSHAAR